MLRVEGGREVFAAGNNIDVDVLDELGYPPLEQVVADVNVVVDLFVQSGSAIRTSHHLVRVLVLSYAVAANDEAAYLFAELVELLILVFAIKEFSECKKAVLNFGGLTLPAKMEA